MQTLNIAILIIIVILVIVVIALILYNLSTYKKIQELSNTNQKVENLSILQEFMDTIGKEESVENKIKIVNDLLIDKYNIKYSSIVVFNGAEYILKATNIEEKFWNTITNLHLDNMFKDSIMTATPKYVTVNNNSEKLSYQKYDMTRAKSAMFFPLYIDNVYIGYWIIESTELHAFDMVDTNILGIIKENIVSVLKTTSYQNTLENIYRIDKTTGLYSAEYLYGKAKPAINSNTQSTICMFTINNIMNINEDFSRNLGTETIIKIVNFIKSNIASQNLFVRYMGPKFVIVFSGQKIEDAAKSALEIKESIEGISIETNKKKNKKDIYIKPITNFALATYYKGTGLEEVTKKLEEFLDKADINDSNVNYI